MICISLQRNIINLSSMETMLYFVKLIITELIKDVIL